jgi:hypothetical protein
MKRSIRNLAGGFILASLVAATGIAAAQDSDDQDQMPMTGAGPMVGSGGYCMPGCVVPPMSGQGMMNQGQMPMMNQDQMPMMGQGMMGQGQMPMMGQGMMMGQGQMPMMGQGMMGQGMMGQGMMGHGMMMDQHASPYLERDLSADDVRHVMEHRLVAIGLPNLVVGSVEETDHDTITVHVVTKDGAPAQSLSVDRHTGQTTPLE